MKKYPMTLQQAFGAMLRGCVVANDVCHSVRYRAFPYRAAIPTFQQRHIYADGRFRKWGGVPFGLVEYEVTANWRIVPTKGCPRE